MQAMAGVFELVRARQDRASRINAERRDENQNRRDVEFAPGDLILLYDEKSTTGLLSDQRPDPPPKGMMVPRKWRMRQTGPHEVLSKAGYDQYYIMNSVKGKPERVDVDSMNPYHPFLPFPWSSIPPIARRRGRPRKISVPCPDSPSPETPREPLRVLKGREQIEELQPGDICLVEMPLDAFEPIAPMLFIRHLEDDQVELQWMGIFKIRWYINIRMYQQPWQLGWFQPKTRQFYWQEKPLTRKYHAAFTNLRSETVIYKKQIFLFGFKLRKDLTLPREVADIALAKYRAMAIPLDAKGKRTSELDLAKGDTDVETAKP
jgi:hypothetical protein